MSLTKTSAPARSDVTTSATARPTPTVPLTQRPYFRHGTMLTVGALAWSSMIVVFGLNSEGTAYQYAHNASAFLFQVGVLSLVRALWRSNAIGSGRAARTVLRIEAGALALAMASTASDFFGLTNLDNPASLALDMFWPISMLGMFLIGIRIAVAGRWQGLSRFYPLVAESWAVVTVPTMGIFGEGVARWVGAAHLVIGYAVLGQIVARKQADGS
ncbi:hypothetical protein [Phycicoccus sp. Soil803]|uniref:hypothetical protein n=1 Tax=Phycicoccus sp. Soil803 TaxID=1736415 RepID=UPI00070E4213|nr:hypothetical protein [Phycicoccus sp. Soil803]KRF23854.1 hypothetical protein ASG95_04100 [Phycicoccus sp. Soil803]